MATEMRVFLETKQGREVVEKQKKAKFFSFEPNSVYFDRFCSVTPRFLSIKRFFIPSELQYDIEWDKIKTLKYVEQEKDRKTSRRKGKDLDGIWWALDTLRTSEREKQFHNIRIETSCHPSNIGFSVLDIKKFLESVRPFLPFTCRIAAHVSKE